MPTWLWVLLANTVAAVLLAFGAYIWRNMEGRIKTMEDDEKKYSNKLIDDPMLSIKAHDVLCGRNMEGIKSIIEAMTIRLGDKMDDSEKRTALLIENAILKSGQNGRVRRARK